jgi:predicted secreted protein
MKNSVSYLLLIVIPLFLAGCDRTPEIKKEAPETNEVKADSKFKIILPEDHTKGTTWQLQQNYDPQVIQQINEVWHGNEKGIYFNLKALTSGQTTLTFISRKYSDTLDIKHFIIKIANK